MTHNSYPRTARRREVLIAVGGITAAATLPGLASADRGGELDNEDFVHPGVNQIDVDGGGADVDIQAAADPATGRGNVAHATSDGVETGDYATSVLSVGRVRLGDIGDGKSLTYEYYKGEDNKAAAPDEVWLYVEDADGDKHVLYHVSNDEGDGVDLDGQEWRKRAVHNEITGNPDPEDNPSFYWFELNEDLTTSCISDHTGSDNVADLVEVFGEDGHILRVGAGRGTFGGDDVADVYYRNPELDGRPIGQFPVNQGRGR